MILNSKNKSYYTNSHAGAFGIRRMSYGCSANDAEVGCSGVRFLGAGTRTCYCDTELCDNTAAESSAKANNAGLGYAGIILAVAMVHVTLAY